LEKRDGATLTTRDGIDPWNESKPTSASGELLGSAAVNDASQWIRWSVKPEVVQHWIAEPNTNRGMILWGTPPGKAVSFASREFGDLHYRPELRLSISIPDAELPALKKALGDSVSDAKTGRASSVWLERGARYRIVQPIIAASDEKHLKDLKSMFEAKDKAGGLEMVETGKARRLDGGSLLVLDIHDEGILDRALGNFWNVECRHFVDGANRGKVFVFGFYWRENFVKLEQRSQ
jgi:hypothetical protein